MDKKFHLITDFVNELDKLYGKKLKPLCLYKNLLEKIKPNDKNYDKFMEKHIKAFETWTRENKVNILGNETTFEPGKILYTNRVFIDMNEIFSLVAQDEDSDELLHTIHDYLLTFSAFLDPTSSAKQILKENNRDNIKENPTGAITTKLSSNKEGQFLSGIFSKIENSIDPNSSNPMDAIGSLMSSGAIMDLFNGLSGGIQDGSMNIGSLMGELTGLVGSMSSSIEAGNDPNAKSMLKMANDSINTISKGMTGDSMGNSIDNNPKNLKCVEMPGDVSETLNTPNIKELDLD
jgi:hypothetical protein